VEDKRPLDGSSFFVRKDKQAGRRGPVPGSSFFVRKDKQALFKDLGPSFFELGPRTLVKGQKRLCF
jgi:RNA binding exosome subunit